MADVTAAAAQQAPASPALVTPATPHSPLLVWRRLWRGKGPSRSSSGDEGGHAVSSSAASGVSSAAVMAVLSAATVAVVSYRSYCALTRGRDTVRRSTAAMPRLVGTAAATDAERRVAAGAAGAGAGAGVAGVATAARTSLRTSAASLLALEMDLAERHATERGLRGGSVAAAPAGDVPASPPSPTATAVMAAATTTGAPTSGTAHKVLRSNYYELEPHTLQGLAGGAHGWNRVFGLMKPPTSPAADRRADDGGGGGGERGRPPTTPSLTCTYESAFTTGSEYPVLLRESLGALMPAAAAVPAPASSATATAALFAVSPAASLHRGGVRSDVSVQSGASACSAFSTATSATGTTAAGASTTSSALPWFTSGRRLSSVDAEPLTGGAPSHTRSASRTSPSLAPTTAAVHARGRTGLGADSPGSSGSSSSSSSGARSLPIRAAAATTPPPLSPSAPRSAAAVAVAQRNLQRDISTLVAATAAVRSSLPPPPPPTSPATTAFAAAAAPCTGALASHDHAASDTSLTAASTNIPLSSSNRLSSGPSSRQHTDTFPSSVQLAAPAPPCPVRVEGDAATLPPVLPTAATELTPAAIRPPHWTATCAAPVPSDVDAADTTQPFSPTTMARRRTIAEHLAVLTSRREQQRRYTQQVLHQQQGGAADVPPMTRFVSDESDGMPPSTEFPAGDVGARGYGRCGSGAQFLTDTAPGVFYALLQPHHYENHVYSDVTTEVQQQRRRRRRQGDRDRAARADAPQDGADTLAEDDAPDTTATATAAAAAVIADAPPALPKPAPRSQDRRVDDLCVTQRDVGTASYSLSITYHDSETGTSRTVNTTALPPLRRGDAAGDSTPSIPGLSSAIGGGGGGSPLASAALPVVAAAAARVARVASASPARSAAAVEGPVAGSAAAAAATAAVTSATVAAASSAPAVVTTAAAGAAAAGAGYVEKPFAAPLPPTEPQHGPRLQGVAGRNGEMAIGAFLGGGACGKVYECLNTETGQVLAAKQIVFDAKDRKLRTRLKQLELELEVLTLAARHRVKWIVGFFGAEKRGHSVLMYLEYCERGSLLDYMVEGHSADAAVWGGASATGLPHPSSALAAARSACGDGTSCGGGASGVAGRAGRAAHVGFDVDASPPAAAVEAWHCGTAEDGADGAANCRITDATLRGLREAHRCQAQSSAAGGACTRREEEEADEAFAVRRGEPGILASAGPAAAAGAVSPNVQHRSSSAPTAADGCCDARSASTPTASVAFSSSTWDTMPLSEAMQPQMLPLSIQQVQCFTRQIVEGLCFMHAHNYAHLDVKTANVLITADEQCRLADLGCAMRLQPPPPDASAASATAQGLNPAAPVAPYAVLVDRDAITELRGTALYMAPEMIRFESHAIGSPADIWSLGCVVMEMATGCAPWRHIAKDKLRVLYRIGSARGELPLPPLLRAWADEASEWLAREGPSTADAAAAAGVVSPPEEAMQPAARRRRLDDAAVAEAASRAAAMAAEEKLFQGQCRATQLYVELVDFIAACVRVRPEHRSSADELLRHPFLTLDLTAE